MNHMLLFYSHERGSGWAESGGIKGATYMRY